MSRSDLELPPDLHLGMGVELSWTQWRPDRNIPANAERYKDLPDIVPCGCLISHPSAATETGRCEGSVLFDLPGMETLFVDRPRWKVESWDPLTLSPSVLCTTDGHNFHGWVREGKWVPA